MYLNINRYASSSWKYSHAAVLNLLNKLILAYVIDIFFKKDPPHNDKM